MKKYQLPDHFAKRVVMSVGGVLLGAFSVGFFKNALFGVDPFQCFAQGFHGAFCANVLTYGTFYVIVNFLMLIIDLFLDRHYLNLGTFINLFLTGYVAAFSEALVKSIFPTPGYDGRLAMLAVGLLIMCFASALYMTADMGVSVYDAIPIVISNRTGKPFRYMRITTDLICVTIGTVSAWLAHLDIRAFIGIGTVLTALCMGPMIEFFNNLVARPLLYGRKGKQ